MEGVEGMLKKLNLSETEKKGVKIGWRRVQQQGQQQGGGEGSEEAHVGQAREAWKRKAVENGSWTFGKDLLVMEDFDPAKSIDEYTFEKVPIWVRIFNVPLGMMCKELAENIAEQIRELVEVDTGEDGTALGQYLRMKVRIRVVDPLMRGLYLDEEEDIDGDAIVKERRGKEDEGRKMCYFQYEFLPDFFYTCGRMGHTDRECRRKLKKGEVAEYGRWLRYVPEASHGYEERRRGEADYGGSPS
ncbi:hypothetical protein D1007_46450 [Hordeum vulgare]|nr:hypothetical protein D1007_46450 [Hordeum vulgare]